MEKRTHIAIFDVNDALSLQLNAIKIRDEEDIPKAIDIAIAHANKQIESAAAKGHNCTPIDFSPAISQFPDSLRVEHWSMVIDHVHGLLRGAGYWVHKTRIAKGRGSALVIWDPLKEDQWQKAHETPAPEPVRKHSIFNWKK